MPQTISRNGATVSWHPERALRQLRKELERRFERAGVKLEEAVKRNISTPTATAGPSDEGEFPHRDTGALLAGISHTVAWRGDVLTVFVTSAAPHTVYLEYNGRSFLRRTLAEEWPKLKKDLTR